MNSKQLEPQNFQLETTSVWSFPDHGNWATHNGKYRGNFSPYIPRNVILRYSKEKDLVLDQFVGGGTTLIEAKLLNRIGLGIDVNSSALELTKSKLQFRVPTHNTCKSYLHKGDASNLNFIPDESIDLICTHPPYADIIKYSKDCTDDLSLLTYDNFISKMTTVAQESFRVLKKGKYCAILIGDLRRHGFVKPLGFEVLKSFLSANFMLKELVIKEQHNCIGTKKWENISNRNFLLLAHEYLFIFLKK